MSSNREFIFKINLMHQQNPRWNGMGKLKIHMKRIGWSQSRWKKRFKKKPILYYTKSKRMKQIFKVKEKHYQFVKLDGNLRFCTSEYNTIPMLIVRCIGWWNNQYRLVYMLCKNCAQYHEAQNIVKGFRFVFRTTLRCCLLVS